MSYTPSLTTGTPAAGVNLPPDAEGGMGVLTAIYQEHLTTNRELSDAAFTLQALSEIRTLLTDIRGFLEAMAKKG
jgi:hypothetical protein